MTFTDQLAHPQSLRRKAAGNVPENGFKCIEVSVHVLDEGDAVPHAPARPSP